MLAGVDTPVDSRQECRSVSSATDGDEFEDGFWHTVDPRTCRPVIDPRVVWASERTGKGTVKMPASNFRTPCTVHPMAK